MTDADAEVTWLRALARGAEGALASGTLELADSQRTGTYAANVRVSIRDARSVVREVRTDGFGRFEPGWLSPGRYSMTVPAGQGFATIEHAFDVKPTSRCLQGVAKVTIR